MTDKRVYVSGSVSFVVVGFSFDNGKCAVQLLSKNGSDHLVGKSHLRKRYFHFAARIDLGAEAVGASDCKYNIPAIFRSAVFDKTGKAERSELLSPFVQKYQFVGGLNL